MAFEETAERRRIGITEMVADLLHGQVRTGGKQVLRLRSEVLLDIIAGGEAHFIFYNHREMARRKMRFFCVESDLMLLTVVHGQEMAELIEDGISAVMQSGIIVHLAPECV